MMWRGKFMSNSSWAINLPCLLIVLSTVLQSQSSPNSQMNSETDRIIAFGDEIFKSIADYRQEGGNIVEHWRYIANEFAIQELISHSPDDIVDRYYCKEEIGLTNVKSMLRYLDEWYEKFEQYLLHENDDGLRNDFLANVTVSHDLGLLDDNIFFGSSWYIVEDPYTYHELFKFTVDFYNPMVHSNCNSVQSLNQYIYNVLNRILLGFIKIYGILIYSYIDLLIKMNTQDDTLVNSQIKKFLREGLEKAINDYEMNTKISIENALNAMEQSSRAISSRDPPIHIKGLTYDSLDYSLQSYVTIQEYQIHRDQCLSKYLQHDDTVQNNNTDDKTFQTHPICTGQVRDCRGAITERIYLSPMDNTRRYGNLSNIPSTPRILRTRDRVSVNCSMFLATDSRLSHCQICSCICDMINSQKSIRYIDLQPRRSNSDNSFVITGIRFTIIDQILYLQIQEGKLKYGRIDQSTVTWSNINDSNRNHDYDNDLFKLDHDNRILDLSDLTLPAEFALTMVKFTIMNGIISLRIEGRSIINGELNVLLSKKAFNQSAGAIRPMFHFNGMDLPTGDNVNNYQVSEPNKFLLQFRTSDWKEDAGQNVPFIDLQNVVADPPTPVAGFGIHVRYGNTSGGFLAPKLISVDNSLELAQSSILQNTGGNISPLFLHKDKLNHHEVKPHHNKGIRDSFIRLG